MSFSGFAIEIKVYDGDKLVCSQVFDQAKIVIGRIQSADFRVPDNRVSRIHALLEQVDGSGLRLTDLASSHGTFVNGDRIVEKVIGLSDKISFANLRVEFKPVQTKVTTSSVVAPPPPQATAAAPVSSAPSTRVEVKSSGDAVSVHTPREATVIRSLKETAKTRGVLDPAGLNELLEVTEYWEETILKLDHYKGSQTLTLGEDPHATYLVPMTEGTRKFPFIKTQQGSAEITLHNSMKGSFRIGSQMKTLDDLRAAGQSTIRISGNDLGKLQIGKINFFLMFVPTPPPTPKRDHFKSGGLFWFIQGGTLLLTALLVGATFLMKGPLEGEVTELPQKYRKIVIEEFKKKIEAQKIVEKKTEIPPAQIAVKNPPPAPKQRGNEGEGARERGVEGKRGLENAKNEKGVTNRPRSAKNLVKDAAVRQKNEGLLASLRNAGLGTKLAKVSGVEQGASGNDPLNKALSGVGGSELVSGRGSGGSGLQGTGKGGGGTAVGVGGLGTKGYGGGASGTGMGSLPGKTEYVVGTEDVSVQVLGGLSREQIARVVRLHLNEVNYCYSREIQRDPKLFGKIALRWNIDSSGAVTAVSSNENSTGSKALEQCVSEKVKFWKFPSNPVQNTTVDWPFIFKPQGT